MKRTWHSGPPPHIGWWNASTHKNKEFWRWWSGERWSIGVHNMESSHCAMTWAYFLLTGEKGVQWTNYWPTNGRVPRINPATGKVTGKIKGEEA